MEVRLHVEVARRYLRAVTICPTSRAATRLLIRDVDPQPCSRSYGDKHLLDGQFTTLSLLVGPNRILSMRAISLADVSRYWIKTLRYLFRSFNILSFQVITSEYMMPQKRSILSISIQKDTKSQAKSCNVEQVCILEEIAYPHDHAKKKIPERPLTARNHVVYIPLLIHKIHNSPSSTWVQPRGPRE